MFTQHIRNYSQNVAPNNFIGGIAKTGGTGVDAVINTKELLATRLNIDVKRISAFKVIGNNVQCRIRNDYTLPNDCFRNSLNIKSWVDSVVNTVDNGALQNCVNLDTIQLNNWSINSGGGFPKITNTKITELKLPEMVNFVGSANIQNNSLLQSLILPKAIEMTSARCSVGNPLLNFIDIKKVKKINGSYGYTGYFNTTATVAMGCIVNCNIFMATCNSGGVEGDIMHIKTARNGIINFYDDAGIYVSTL